jgi:elongation factor G
VETIRKPASAHARYKKQTGGRGQFADCKIEIAPAETGDGLVFEDAIKGGVIPGGFIPAVEKGVAEAMQHGEVAGYPVKDVRVRLFDGSHHSVDSSEMAFKICGSMAFKQAMAEADPALLEPIVHLEISVPEECVGDIIGDLSSRRGHPLGMEPKPGLTRIEAEVPMAEVLDYARDLRAITGGRGEYTVSFARYEELPAHLAQEVAAATSREAEQLAS